MSEARPAPQRIIRFVDGVPQIATDDWHVVEHDARWGEIRREIDEEHIIDEFSPGGAPHSHPLLLPLDRALAHAERLPELGRIGVWLGPTDEPERAVALFPRIQVIGVHFPKFTDGRGYSTAALLRSRHGWRGELRAFGDILQDQLFALRRVGFDTFVLRADRDPETALRGFTVFSGSYQGAVDQPLPRFRRTEVPA